MAIERQEMPERDPLERSRTFDEVDLGFTERIAVLEARRCSTASGRRASRLPGRGRHPGLRGRRRAWRPARAARILFASNACRR
jgi:hypothetical protein